MDMHKVSKVEVEARRLLERVKQVKERSKEGNFIFYGCRETASLRRQSMELTNALADLRKH